MDKYIEKIFSAIYKRISVRNFEAGIIRKKDLEMLEDFIKSIRVPFTDTVDIILFNSQEIASPFLINTTYSYASFSSFESITDIAKTGFIGELFILYCESIGISSCWIGIFKSKEAYSNLIKKKGSDYGKKIYALAALGYSSGRKGFLGTVTQKLYSSNKKSFLQNLSKDSLKEFPEFIKKALEAASKAPSARNKQCWNFEVLKDNNAYIVKIFKNPNKSAWGWKYPDLDAGIAASHFWASLVNEKISTSLNLMEKDNTVIWEFKIGELKNIGAT